MSEDPTSRLAPTRDVPVVRITADAVARQLDVAAVEEPLEVRLHDRPFAVIMRTPGADRTLAAGFLLAEGVVAGAHELGAVEHCRHPAHPEVHNVVNVFLLGEARHRLDERLAGRRHVTASASCGMCGRVTIDSLETRLAPLGLHTRVSTALVRGLPDGLRQQQRIFDRTGGLHAAALYTAGGRLVSSAEDVGRHNAVDKVVGAMLFDDALPLAGHALVVSGRTSFEIVQKAWVAGIELVCAVSAPSSLAIDTAEAAGITLIGFAREQGFNVYSHPERLDPV
jgi:FdhD protein